jgi:hypothetical protein
MQGLGHGPQAGRLKAFVDRRYLYSPGVASFRDATPGHFVVLLAALV